MGGMASDFTAMIQKWWARPFSTENSAGMWFLTLGFIIVAVVAWNMVLRHVVAEN